METYIVIDPLEAARFVRPTSPLAQDVLAEFPAFTPFWYRLARAKDRWQRDQSPRLRRYVARQLS